ncbi:MAG: FprA family A-type flavoprotein [Erysipelotrichaceae bacterium]
MQNTHEIAPGLHWVGGNERRLQRFENLFPLRFGVAYNSYLIVDEKTCLLDTVDSSISQLFIDNVDYVLNGRDLDFLVVNHMEPDHCGNIETIIRRYPNVKFIGNAKTFQFFEQFYRFDASKNYMQVKDLEELDLGSRKLRFYTAPMVHWPEVMMTLDFTNHILFSSDAYGTFGAHNGTYFADEMDYRRDHLDEARRYYSNIVGKFGVPVQGIMKKLSNEVIDMICPLHGPMYRNEELALILDKYEKWSKYIPETKSALIIYATMYNNTESVADKLATRLGQYGVRDMRVYDVSEFDPSYLVSEAWKYSHIVIASPTYNSNVFYKIYNLLHELASLNLQNRKFSFVVNSSWGGQTLEQLQAIVDKMKNIEIIGEPLLIKSTLREENYEALDKLAKAISESIHKS